MSIEHVLRELHRIVNEARTALLATVDGACAPHVRWITPGFLDSTPRSVFFITSRESDKVAHIESHPRVQWLFQTPSLNSIVSLDARCIIHDNPALVGDVLEQVARRLTTFWKVRDNTNQLVAVESIIETAQTFDPARGTRATVRFDEGGQHGGE